MNSKTSTIGAIALTMILIGTALFVPAGSIEIEQEKNIINNPTETTYDGEVEAYRLDRRYIMNPDSEPLNLDDYDDAGYRRDVGDEIKRSYGIYPGEPVDNWPGRGNTGKISSSDEADWYFFCVSVGQQFEITLTPPSGFDVNLELFNDDGDQLASSTNPGSAVETITYSAPYSGEMFMGVIYVSGTGEGQYTFDVEINSQNDAGMGIDAGDDFSSATSISPGIYYGYHNMNDEEDWYKFSASAGQGIHFILKMRRLNYLSDCDIYLYNPAGELVHYETYYYDDELWYPADVTGEWRARIKLFPGYTDVPQPTEWDYFTYGSGPYELELILEGSAPSPPEPIPQPDITPIAQTFKVSNDPLTSKDEYGYLASVPANNYLKDGDRYLAPVVYEGDNTPTEWFGTVDDTTNYLLDDWNSYLSLEGKGATVYTVDADPVKAASDIAKTCWDTSSLAVVAVDGSSYEDEVQTVLEKTKTLQRNVEVMTIPSTSEELQKFGDYYAKIMLLGGKWGALLVETTGDFESPSVLGIYPQYMSMANDWWPEHEHNKNDIFFPVPSAGIYAVGVGSVSRTFDMKISKYECDRYKIRVNNPDSVLTATVTTPTESDLLVFLMDPDGYIRAPDIPYWNGGEISPIHGWNGMDNPSIPPPTDEWKSWDPEPHTEFTAEVLHPEVGTWEVVVVPRYPTGSSSIQYSLTGTIRVLNQKRLNAELSAANAAVIASQEHVPLLYVTEDSVPANTQGALTQLGVSDVILVQNGDIASGAESQLPSIQANLKTTKQIVDHIKSYSNSENYITITSLRSGKGFFAPSAMIAAYHCSPVLRIGDAPGNPAGMANRIDTWLLWDGDYYHGTRSIGHLPIYDEPVEQMTPFKLLLNLIKYVITGSGELPPLGLDAKRYWTEEMHDGIHNYINSLGLDRSGQEAYLFVSPRKDIRVVAHSAMMGNNSYAGHIPGDTPAYANDIIVRNILYPALIQANPGRDVTTTQLMNYPDGTQWRTNDGISTAVYSSRVLKKSFSSHGRTYEGHVLWEAHLQRMNDGASIMYYSGHGTGGSGMSAQYIQTENCRYPDQIWPDAWRGYSPDDWETARDNGFTWYNPEPPNLYDIIHYKWHDQLFDNLRSNAIFYMSCTSAHNLGPIPYLDHGAVCFYGNAGSGLCPEADLQDDEFFKDALINGLPIGEAFSKQVWLHYRDFTTKDPISMYGPSSTYGGDGITTIQCIYGDPNLIIYSPEWQSPVPVDSDI
jgi:hypothetical protein